MDPATHPGTPTSREVTFRSHRVGQALRRGHDAIWPYPEVYAPGNQISLYLAGGRCYSAMLKAIGAARRHIYLETYILRADHTGQRFAAALEARAREGLRVALLYDGLGSFGLPEPFLAGLREAGVELIAYRPPWPWKKRWGLNQRDHRKILSLDGELGFVGGMNISDQHAPLSEGGEGWRDTHLGIDGPAAIQLQRLFVEEWARQGGSPLPEDSMRCAHRPGIAARVVENRHLARRALVRGSYFDALYHARSSVWITNSYFAPDRRFVRALMRAARRGIDVRIILAGKSDAPLVVWAGEVLHRRLLGAGVRLFRWTESMLHAKTCVVDGRWSTVGTYNLDQRSFRFNLEVNATVIGPEIASQLEAAFKADLEHCTEITRAEVDARGLGSRLRSLFAYLFRRWL